MKTKFTLLIIVLALFGLSNQANAQSPVLEKTYDVSGKAKRGFLGGVEVNKEKGAFDLVFLTSGFFSGAGNATSGFDADVPVEIYSYDKELNFLNSDKTKVSANKYSWFNYRGLYTFEMVKCMVNLGGLSFQKVNRQYMYEPKTGQYYINREKVLEKEHPKTADGNRYSFYAVSNYDVAAERSSIVVAGKKIDKSAATKENKMHLFNHMMHYDVMHCDKDLNVVVTDSVNFNCVNTMMYSGQIKDQRRETNDELARDWVLIYAGSWIDNPKMMYQAPNPTSYTYIRITPQGKVVDKIAFDSPANAWKVEGVYEENNAVYIYGSAIVKDREKKNMSDVIGSGGWDKATYTHYQIGKISGGKFDFLKVHALKDMQAKLMKPSTQKKMLEITGKKEETTGLILASNGDIYVNYQNYDTGEQGKDYKSMFLFQFDPSGNIKKNYGIDLPEHSNKEGAVGKPAQNYFFPSGDGKSLYWFLTYPKSAACTGTATAEYNNRSCWPLLGVDYTSVNIETGELAEMKTFGKEKKNEFYLFGTTTKPYQLDNFIYFFSEDENEKGKGGDNMRLTRIDISK